MYVRIYFKQSSFSKSPVFFSNIHSMKIKRCDMIHCMIIYETTILKRTKNEDDKYRSLHIYGTCIPYIWPECYKPYVSSVLAFRDATRYLVSRTMVIGGGYGSIHRNINAIKWSRCKNVEICEFNTCC